MKHFFKRFVQTVLIIILMIGLYLGGCILFAYLTYYNPTEKIVLRENKQAKPISDSTFSLITWNIGYCGLGAETDFFYDGGKMMNPSEDFVHKYLNGVKQTLQENAADFYVIQEVDQDSKRSYHINEIDSLANALKMESDFATNYNVKYVPLPYTEPMGKVLAGLQTFSKYAAESSTRFQLPGAFEYPKQLFFLRRCLLLNRYKLSNGKDLVIINLHNSAYDKTGELNKLEKEYLKKLAEGEYEKGNYVVIGGDWNQCPPEFPYDKLAKGKEGDYAQTNVEKDYIKGWQWVYDSTFATNRKNDHPFNEKTFVTLIDFFLISPNVKVQSVKGIDVGFKYSDHQPVKLEFAL